MSDAILIERIGAIQILRLNRPEKKNALTRAMYASLTQALRDGDADDSVRVHLFLGVPGAFSAGNDLGDFLTMASGQSGGEEVWAFLLALAGAAKPVVSGVDGIAVGIGTTLNLHCDVTVASPRTVFHTPFTDLGLVPEAASSLLLPRIIGPQRAFAMLALGEKMSAQEALQAGLVKAIVEPDRIEAEAIAAAQAIAAKPREALRIARDLIRGPREAVMARIGEEAEHFRAQLNSPEAKAALTAFLERRR